MRPILRLSTVLYLVLSVLAGVPAGASRVVLCVAPNGHVEIEAGSGRCVDAAAPAAGALDASAPRMAPEDCDDCVDVPLGMPVLSEARGHGPGFGAQAQLVAPALAPVLASASWNAPAPGTSAHGADTRSAFPPSRTTIFRN